MIWKKIIYAVAFLTLMLALGVFNHSEASSFSLREEVSQPGHKFGGRKALKKKNKRNKRLLKKWGLGEAIYMKGEASC